MLGRMKIKHKPDLASGPYVWYVLNNFFLFKKQLFFFSFKATHFSSGCQIRLKNHKLIIDFKSKIKNELITVFCRLCYYLKVDGLRFVLCLL